MVSLALNRPPAAQAFVDHALVATLAFLVFCALPPLSPEHASCLCGKALGRTTTPSSSEKRQQTHTRTRGRTSSTPPPTPVTLSNAVAAFRQRRHFKNPRLHPHQAPEKGSDRCIAVPSFFFIALQVVPPHAYASPTLTEKPTIYDLIYDLRYK